MEFSNKTVVITGGASGIGKQTAEKLGLEGCKIILADIQENKAKETVVELQGMGIDVKFVKTDISEIQDIRNLFSKTISCFKKIDILVNCAGMCSLTKIPDITVEEWDRILAVNLKASFFCSQEALKHMCEKKYGKIINIASASGKIGGVAVGAHYSASKAALICLTKSLALYSAPYHINVNCVCPGPIATAMTDAWGKKINTEFAEKIPFKRYGKPDEVAEAILFLASDRAKYITGETLDVNGGLVMD